jgi:hypothetical protein
MKKFGKSTPMMLSDKFSHSVSVSRSEANGVTVDEWLGMASSTFTLESMIWKSPKASLCVDVDAAEFSDFVGCVSNKANEVTAEVCMNLRRVDIGKVVGAWSNGPQGSVCAGANTSKDMVKVFCGEEVVGLVRRTGKVALLGVEFGVVGGRSAHAVNEASIKEMRLCQTLSPFLMMGNSNMFSLNQMKGSN